MFFGLSLRQFIFSLIAVLVAVGIYFGLYKSVGTETVSWMCIVGESDFEKSILIPQRGDNLDVYINEYNKMLMDKAMGANSFVQDKYITASVAKKDIEEARNYFSRIGADLISHFARLGSKCIGLDTIEKLRIFYDF